MSEITERTQKLLILAGDEGQALEARDFGKVVDVIVNNYLSTSRPPYQQFLLDILPSAISRIPFKQHIYAGLTAEITKINPQLAVNLVRAVTNQLDTDLSALKLHESINAILYLSELMNLEKLNSQCFFDLLDDIVNFMENCKNQNHRNFFVLLYSRTLHRFCFSLNKKVSFQFKKQLERAKKICNKNTEFCNIFQSIQKGNVLDGSIISRLYGPEGSEFSSENQIQQNLKLVIEIPQQRKWQQIEYLFFEPSEDDKLYQQFLKNQAPLFLTDIEQLIELMKQNSTFLSQKLISYLNGSTQNSSFLQKYCVQLLIARALKSKTTIVQSFILIKLVQSNRIYAELVQNSLKNGLSFKNEDYDLKSQLKYSQVLSYVVKNWPNGQNDMTDIAPWDWEKFISDTKREQQTAKRNVVLKIVCQKIQLLAENYKFPSCLKEFAPPEKLSSPTKYKAIEDMQRLQNFQQLLKNKAQSEQVLQSIKTQSDYEIFLEALFQKTSLSHTHLQVLFSRYSQVFQKQKAQHDWTLLNTVRSYWSKSIFHRILYLQTLISRGFVEFPSYVKYISKVEAENEEQSQWVKMQLSQLHTKFMDKLQA